MNSVNEALTHVKATTQFSEWSAHAAARKHHALQMLSEAAKKLGRAPTREEVIQLSGSTAHPGTGAGDLVTGLPEVGSDYLNLLPDGIPWDLIADDEMLPIDVPQRPLSVSSSIRPLMGRTRVSSPSPPPQAKIPPNLMLHSVKTIETIGEVERIQHWGTAIPLGAPPDDRAPRTPSSTAYVPPDLPSSNLASILEPSGLKPPMRRISTTGGPSSPATNHNVDGHSAPPLVAKTPLDVTMDIDVNCGPSPLLVPDVEADALHPQPSDEPAAQDGHTLSPPSPDRPPTEISSTGLSDVEGEDGGNQQDGEDSWTSSSGGVHDMED